MTEAKRRLGFEQEFFLVDRTGAISHRADEFLSRCQAIATEKGSNPDCFAPEWVKHIVEINTNPVNSVTELTQEYFSNLQIAIQAGQELDLRLYPLSTYPLHVMPIIRNKLWYHVQLRTVGYDRFLHAGRCTGTHLHLEVEPGAIDPRIGVSYDATLAAKAEILNLFNLATAFDAALIALSRACPFYEGRGMNVSAHTVHYRGRNIFGWEGVYTNLQAVGGLQPYVHSVEELVELQFGRYHAWLEAMDRAGVERHLFYEAGGSMLKTAWNRVRLNKIGTIELRGTDSNYPDRILAIATLVSNAAARVRRENLTVRPKAGVKTFQLNGDRLEVPEFEYLDNDLLYAAVTEGVKNCEVKDYLDSLFEFATQDGENINLLTKFRSDLGEYETTEAELLQEFPTSTGEISLDEGLRLVRQSCDKLEQQVFSVIDR
ncbi:glutamate--cysteine ligase [Chroococcidiopsis sp. CCALA 051]|uniref:glutamate-cysteine ligase family protein n=1 Tax=Chroococcidiopsis sp. CCALA 051 TaxID=869949 RepID=UPI000D0DDB3A|nr:glutamate-cysteine ligase family protein [Chroococcidiopsis sp. CCALA 051]PSM48237.1 glutamate--cysteine ligase [Chroococcidiopsis sp. CCALA 051]